MPNEVQRKMKDSGIEWVGWIPEDWDLMRVKDGFFQKKAQAHIEDPVVLSLARSGVKIRDMESAEGQFASSYYNYNPVDIDDMLINPMDLISGDNCSLSKVQGVISPAYVNLRYKAGFFPDYYQYYFKYQYWSMAFFAHGKGVSFDNRWTLNNDTLMKYPLLVPPTQTQKEIASFLDSKCAEIDSLRADIEREIDTLEEYKKSVITEAVTKGLDPNVPMKDSGIPWIGMIPSHWPIYRIADLYEDRNERGNDELPLLSVSINSGVSDKELSEDEQERVFLRSEDKTKYKRVYPGDIAYNMMRAWQGAFGAVRVDGMVSPAYIVAKKTGNAEIDSRYIEALLRSPSGIEEMNRYSYGIMDFRKRLYWPQFRIINVCLPPIEEQRRISNYIDAKAEEINTCIELQKKALEILDEYKKSIIYEYVTGKKKV